MYAAISRFDAPSRRMHGRAEVAFRNADGQTRLSHLHQVAPLRVLFPHGAEGEPPLAALVTTSGGVVGGDKLAFVLETGEAAHALFAAQAAEKVYRSDGADSRIEVALRAGEGSWLEYLPQETILFDGARLRRRTVIEATDRARVLAGEMVVFGRTARAERFTHGLLHEAWEIRRDGKLVWADALRVDGDVGELLAAPACFGGAVAMATIVLVADDAARHIHAVRGLLNFPSPCEGRKKCGVASSPTRGAATVVNGVLLVRWLARDALTMRLSFANVWSELRSAEAGLPKGLPRLWHV